MTQTCEYCGEPMGEDNYCSKCEDGPYCNDCYEERDEIGPCCNSEYL